MTAYPAWTPASRPGIIPLHPLSFGTILGRSFAALRQNPRVLLGFALVVQTVAYLVALGGVLAVAWASFSRLDTLRPGTDEYDTVMAGSIALTAVAGIVLSLALGALSVIVQGIVVVEVAHAAVSEKLTLGQLWRQIKPIVWRLFGYSLLVVVAMSVLIVVLGAFVVGAAIVSPFAAIPVVLLALAAGVPLYWWLSIKLLLVPAAIILEHATIRQALGRSWSLTRGRFWATLGVIFLIGLVFGAVAQVLSFPLSFLAGWLSTVIAPTGASGPSEIISLLAVSLLAQVLTLLVQSVAIVVQSTATAIIYIDCRMRREGLDLDLLAYVERRDAGATALPDPYREHVGREIAPRGFGGPVPAPGYMPSPLGHAPAYPPPGYAPAPGYPPAPTGNPAPGYPPLTSPAPGYPPAYPSTPRHAAVPGYPSPAAFPAPSFPAPTGAAPAGFPPAQIPPPSQQPAPPAPLPAPPIPPAAPPAPAETPGREDP